MAKFYAPTPKKWILSVLSNDPITLRDIADRITDKYAEKATSSVLRYGGEIDGSKDKGPLAELVRAGKVVKTGYDAYKLP